MALEIYNTSIFRNDKVDEPESSVHDVNHSIFCFIQNCEPYEGLAGRHGSSFNLVGGTPYLSGLCR
jgi:hypothetical protein